MPVHAATAASEGRRRHHRHRPCAEQRLVDDESRTARSPPPLWQDFAERSLHELALKTKALTQAYYLQAQRKAYWDGCSTGGRQGYKIAQNHPTDYDGYLVGAPAFNWTKFITAELYPQIVYQRDLGGVPLSTAQLNLVSGQAVSTCDVVNGTHLGYVPDPSTCAYDPTEDASVICTGVTINGVTGTNGTARLRERGAGTGVEQDLVRPDARRIGARSDRRQRLLRDAHDSQLWYGLERGSTLSGLAGANPFTIATDMVALELQDPTIATPSFMNATGNGANGWKSLSYGAARERLQPGHRVAAVLRQHQHRQRRPERHPAGGREDHPVPRPRRRADPGAELAELLQRVANLDGGYANTQKYDRLFMIAGMGHCAGVGTAQGTAGVSPPATTNSVPLPAARPVLRSADELGGERHRTRSDRRQLGEPERERAALPVAEEGGLQRQRRGDCGGELHLQVTPGGRGPGQQAGSPA